MVVRRTPLLCTDCRIRSESLRIGSGFPIVFVQYTSLAIYNNIENGHGGCNITILMICFIYGHFPCSIV